MDIRKRRKQIRNRKSWKRIRNTNNKAYKKEVVARAEGEASRFISIYNEYAKAKEVIDSGFALKQLEKLIHWSNENIDS